MRRRFAVLLIFGMLVFSGALFADSISDVFFVSGRVTASGFPAMFTIEEGAEPFPPLGVSINGMIKGVNGMPPMLAVMLLDKNNTASDVIFTEMINGVEKLTFCSEPFAPGCKIPKGYVVDPIPETGGVQDITKGFNLAGTGDITIQSTPEPGTLVLFGTGLASMAGLIRWKLKNLI
jgi:hypothetical protein